MNSRGKLTVRRGNQSPDQWQGQRGMTVVETIVATTLIVSIVVLLVNAIASMTSIRRSSSAEGQQQARYRTVLEELRRDLVACSLAKNPVNNQFRYQIYTDGNGKEAIRFQKLIGARMVADELQAVWSPFIDVNVRPNGMVARTENGETRLIGSGIKEITYSATTLRGFRVRCTTQYREPNTGETKEKIYEEYIAPMY